MEPKAKSEELKGRVKELAEKVYTRGEECIADKARYIRSSPLGSRTVCW